MCVCVGGGGSSYTKDLKLAHFGHTGVSVILTPLSHLVAMIFECILGKSDTYFLCIVRQ